ncbi:ribosome maturation factor RimM [Nostoc parmelioides]|uniref:Ribosome maturation factor RimM n=1 Tax=Nostoc parmelioides FACHB-3921 TaxID=2692909 RepID=A0ABR8BC45_9NOSO|nr:ribosome maturation factor RimM [Nostoc parmelioides]MBD2250537.1 ribosome maturation factor RimM [Nostoc parmelioides FACHB-3921]
MKRKQDSKGAGSRGQGEQGRQGEKFPVPKPQTPVPSPQFSTPNPDEWLQIGKIVSAQGLSGEVRVYPDSDFPERFEVPGTRWLLRPGQTEPQPIELLHGRYLENKNLYVLQLAGVENRSQSEELRGCMLFVPASDRPELGEDEYHVVDLIGMEVFLQTSGDLVGTVVDVIPAGNDLLEVSLHEPVPSDKKPKTVLIPFVKAIAPVVDLQTRRIEITPPPGLLELGSGA